MIARMGDVLGPWRGVALVIAVLALPGCGESPTPADAGADADVEDAAVDAQVDAGPPPGPRWCQACRLDAQCGAGNVCVYFDDGSAGCGRGCASDADCADLPMAATCVEPEPGLGLTCVPSAGTCVDVAIGTPCASAADCRGVYDRCEDGLDARGAICTSACESDADCPFLASHCTSPPPSRGGSARGSFCAPDRAASLDTCRALIDAGRATACDASGGCPTGSTCQGSGALRVCMPAPSGGRCPDGHVLDEAAALCVPSVREDDLVASCGCAIEVAGSMLDEALGLVLRERCEMGFPTEIYRSVYDMAPVLAEIAQDPFRLSFTDQVHGDWLSVPRFATEVARTLDDATGAGDRPIARTLARGAALADLRGADPDAAISGETDLAAALDALVIAAGGTPDASDLAAQVGALPGGMGARLAPVIAALADAVREREAALALYDEFRREDLYALAPALHLGAGVGRAPPATAFWAQGALRGDADVSRMAAAATRLAAAIDEADLATLRGQDATLTIETPAGRIAIRGAGADTYEGSEWAETLFVLDLGGDDTYRAPVGANASITNGVSIAIDLGGVDTYAYVEVPVASDVGPPGHERMPSDGAGRIAAGGSNGPFSLSNVARQGAGRLGIAMLIDLGVEGDFYRSLRMSQGYGALGVGLLWDAGGDDEYRGEAAVQGAASFGLGMLIDRGGRDRYVAYAQSQGFAYARAVGVLHDASGDDEYFAHPSDVLYWSPQNPGGSNSSFSQGAGFGRRADFSDGVFMSGGLAVLRDREGNDRYTVGIFGQATGYWFGTGFLLDGAGDDHYDGEWYVQAGDAHYAIAALIDESGSDRYNSVATRRNAALGGGHDFSVAWLLDLGGDDEWRGPGLSFGTGHAGGFGAFVDAAGVDTYDATGDLSFGNASIETPGDALRRATGSIGIFLERGGADTYARPTIPPLANDSTWTQEAHPDESEHGAGVDRSTGPLGIPGIPE